MKANNSKEAKRQLIIDAAVEVFSRNGYHNTKMGEIAAVAGIGKGTIYEYFDSKLQLFQETLKSGIETYFSSLSKEDLEQKSVEEKIRMVVEGHIHFCRQHGQLTKIVFWDAETLDDEVKEWMYQMRKDKEAYMNEFFADAIARGELREMDPYLVTLMVAGIIGSMWAPLVLEKWDIDASKLAEQITDVIMNGIKK
ncbi:MAG: TetR/AcrR family transcriptional regulator [Bacillota bacterium]|nr:TetR/AcrR family transcriptional regulator [Bacillota bacterium]